MKKLVLILLLLTHIPIKGITGECYSYNGYRIKRPTCPCNCYKYKNTASGRCYNCWHHIIKEKDLPMDSKLLSIRLESLGLKSLGLKSLGLKKFIGS